MKKAYILAIVTVCMWGTLPAATKMLLNRIPEVEYLCIAALIATIFLFVVNLVTGQLKELKAYKIKDYVIIFALGILGTLFYNLFYNYGMARMTSQEACIINYLWPVFIVIFSCIVLKEKMTVQKLIGILLSFFGIVVLVTKLEFHNLKLDSPLGVLGCILAALCYGLFCTLNKKKSYNEYVSMMMYFGITALITGIMTGIRGDFMMVTGVGNWLGFLWAGAVGNGFAYLCWSLALAKGDTSRIANIAYITPFLAIIISGILLKESISIYAFLGLVFILAGIFIQLIKKQKGKKEVCQS